MSAGRFYKLWADVASRRDIPPAAKVLSSVLEDRMGKNGCCWPGVRTLAKDCGVNESTISEAVSRLEEVGMLIVERRVRGACRSTNIYRLAPKSAWKIPTPRKPKRTENPRAGARKNHTEAHGKTIHNQIDQLNQNNAAAPPATGESKTERPGTEDDHGKPKGAGGRLVGRWCLKYKDRIGRPYPTSGKGQLAGTFKRLLADFTESDLTGALDRWFAPDRQDYGLPLFEHRLRGGAVELLPRPPQAADDALSLSNGRKLAEMAAGGAS